MQWPARTIGLLTAAYGTAVAASPGVLARPCGLTAADGSVPDDVATLTRAIGVRDAVSGVALALAPAGPSTRWMIRCRVVADVGDAIGLGLSLPDPTARRNAALVAGGWGALTFIAGLAARRD